MEVTIAEQNLQVLPGDSVHTVVSVRNSSKTVDVLSIDVQGLDPSWCELSIGSASLFPEDHFESTLSITPPRQSNAAAKSYPFSVVVKSWQDPAKVVSADGTLNVDPFYSYTAELNRGSRALSAASYTLTVYNNSNLQLTFRLEDQGLGENLRLRLDSESVTVEPGARGEVGLTVAPVRRPLSGNPKPHDFELSISTDAGTVKPVVISAQTEAHPWLPVPGWVIPVVLVAAVAAGIAVAVWQLGLLDLGL